MESMFEPVQWVDKESVCSSERARERNDSKREQIKSR